MRISLSTQQGRVPVTVMELMGDIDSHTYTDVIRSAQEIFDNGSRNLLIDLGKVPSSAAPG